MGVGGRKQRCLAEAQAGGIVWVPSDCEKAASEPYARILWWPRATWQAANTNRIRGMK